MTHLSGAQLAQFSVYPPPGEGWTDPVPSIDTKFVYVSSSTGDDTNNTGLTPNDPVQTIAKGKSLLRHNMPDWLLLRSGDIWTNEVFGEWKDAGNAVLNGRGPTEPMVITSYDSGRRPMLKTGVTPGFTHNYGAPYPTLSNVMILGIHFNCHTYTGAPASARGIWCPNPVTNFLVEDCKFSNMWKAVDMDSTTHNPSSGIRIRRNVFQDIYGTDSEAWGVWIGHAISYDTLIEENYIDKVQWSAPNTLGFAVGGYFDSKLIVRRNVITETGFDAIKMGGGGQCYENFLYQCAVGIRYGVDPSDSPQVSNLPLDCYRNVILDGHNNGAISGAGVGIWLRATGTGSVYNNIIARSAYLSADAIVVWGDGWHVANCTMNNNWVSESANAVVLHSSNNLATDISNFHFNENQVQSHADAPIMVVGAFPTLGQIHSFSNLFWGQGGLPNENSWFQLAGTPGNTAFWRSQVVGDTTSIPAEVTYPDVTRTVVDYQAAIGRTATDAAFFSAIRLQERDTWDAAYMAESINPYFRLGFRAG